MAALEVAKADGVGRRLAGVRPAGVDQLPHVCRVAEEAAAAVGGMAEGFREKPAGFVAVDLTRVGYAVEVVLPGGGHRAGGLSRGRVNRQSLAAHWYSP